MKKLGQTEPISIVSKMWEWGVWGKCIEIFGKKNNKLGLEPILYLLGVVWMRDNSLLLLGKTAVA